MAKSKIGRYDNAQGKEIVASCAGLERDLLSRPMPLLFLYGGDDYHIYLPNDVSQIKNRLSNTIPYISGRGLVSGAYLKFGKGRIVLFRDGAKPRRSFSLGHEVAPINFITFPFAIGWQSSSLTKQGIHLHVESGFYDIQVRPTLE